MAHVSSPRARKYLSIDDLEERSEALSNFDGDVKSIEVTVIWKAVYEGLQLEKVPKPMVVLLDRDGQFVASTVTAKAVTFVDTFIQIAAQVAIAVALFSMAQPTMLRGSLIRLFESLDQNADGILQEWEINGIANLFLAVNSTQDLLMRDSFLALKTPLFPVPAPLQIGAIMVLVVVVVLWKELRFLDPTRGVESLPQVENRVTSSRQQTFAISPADLGSHVQQIGFFMAPGSNGLKNVKTCKAKVTLQDLQDTTTRVLTFDLAASREPFYESDDAKLICNLFCLGGRKWEPQGQRNADPAWGNDSKVTQVVQMLTEPKGKKDQPTFASASPEGRGLTTFWYHFTSLLFYSSTILATGFGCGLALTLLNDQLAMFLSIAGLPDTRPGPEIGAGS